ncbi:MAG TPA: MBL fold metallo-hydrolase [Candidatus Polarisedimenticolaceae bacterium]|nr:MBL fold metallo-hydrolase [Candidatus Polarisedimenticolaceae bacterium]
MLALLLASAIAPAWTHEQLGPGVHFFQVPAASTELTNTLVVERADGLLVVDAQPTAAAARALLGEIARFSSKPVRYLVLSNPHAEATGGASAFADSTLLVAAEGCQQALADPAFDVGAESRAQAPKPAEWVAPPRRPPVLILPPARLLLDDPDHPVEILPLRVAHTPGDLLVNLPRDGVLYAGALLFADRNPYLHDGNVFGWLNVLLNLAREEHPRLIPLRGPPLRSDDVRQLSAAFAWARGRVEAAFRDEMPSGRIAERVLADEAIREHFDLSIQPSFVREMLEIVVREALDERRKRGVAVP